MGSSGRRITILHFVSDGNIRPLRIGTNFSFIDVRGTRVGLGTRVLGGDFTRITRRTSTT